MKLTSKRAIVNKSQKEVFDFLCIPENYEQLMPESKEKFEVDGDSFVFALKGMPEIRLVIKNKIEYNSIILGAASSKLEFSLTSSLEIIDLTTSSVLLVFAGDFNPMMAMMIKGPLQKFIDTLAENLEKL
jgi:hypothetical protein